MDQEIYKLLHAVQCNWRCIDGLCDVQITECSTVQLAVYRWFKRCINHCMQYSAICFILIVQKMYRLLHALQCNWWCIAILSDVKITARSTVQLAVYWWIKWCTIYCMHYRATSGVLMYQVMFRLLLAVQCTWRCNDSSSDLCISACSKMQLMVFWWFKLCTD